MTPLQQTKKARKARENIGQYKNAVNLVGVLENMCEKLS
jgi:hypothetical protein